jgi:serine/threonine-protein kinase
VLVGLEAARGLDYAHRRGLVHRDVKPANILFDDDGRLRIADFGIARALAEAAWTEPAGAVLGTVRYAAPEQVQGASIDGRADVYALSLVLVEAVTGTVPFVADTTIATLMARLETPLRAPDTMGPLGAVVEEAGRPVPDERPDAAGFARALERVAHELPAPRPLPLAGSVPADETLQVIHHDRTAIQPRPAAAHRRAAPAPPAPPELPPDAPGRRRRWPWLAALIAAIVLAAGGAYVGVQATRPTHKVPTVENLSEQQAVARLKPLKFEVRTNHRYVDGTLPGQVIGQDPTAGVTRKEGSTVTLTVSRGPTPVRVPAVLGREQPDAVAMLERAHLKRGTVTLRPDENVPGGRVLDRSPKGATLPKGTAVDLVVSSGPAPRPIADFTGRTYEEAANALAFLGLRPERSQDFSDSVEAGKIIRTEPAAAQTAPRGSTVTVVVSKGPDLVGVPPVRGLSVDAATAAIERLGLNVDGVLGSPSKRVFDTDPAAGTRVRRGTGVSLYTR